MSLDYVIKGGNIPVAESFTTAVMIGLSTVSGSKIDGNVIVYDLVNYKVTLVSAEENTGGVFLIATIVNVVELEVESGRVPTTLI